MYGISLGYNNINNRNNSNNNPSKGNGQSDNNLLMYLVFGGIACILIIILIIVIYFLCQNLKAYNKLNKEINSTSFKGSLVKGEEEDEEKLA